MPRSFYSKVAGVSHKNPDGTSRQAALRASWEDRPLILTREPNNPHDSSAIAVFTEDMEQLGYIGSDLSDDLASQMDRGVNVSAAISGITGGGKGQKTLGCNILITVGDAGPDEIIVPAPPKKRTMGCLTKGFILVMALALALAVLAVGCTNDPAHDERMLLREAYDMAQVFVKRRLRALRPRRIFPASPASPWGRSRARPINIRSGDTLTLKTASGPKSGRYTSAKCATEEAASGSF
ncbi:MAG: HIRAN domain-containing protein [Desulfarculaceae bacterium]|nr:HIRAN domain-containing protein [Desulfarculaceae bacterium]MCF8049547.1 HIRAN domain-containing protein [Desulfarculaceae bacterium]MCF8099910.1 HIRAN domain-containing protein [Desulfarculaceae bacterium]MCF8123866.1 HIRAN domain-containing protein [Desulfarculaceae bacterium]